MSTLFPYTTLFRSIATATCPDDYTAAFIAGTEPRETCDQQAGDNRNLFQKLFGLGPKPLPPPAVSNPNQQPGQQNAQTQPGQQAEQQSEDAAKKKKGFFGKLFGAFKDDKKEDNKSKKDASKPAPPPPTPH